MMRLETPLDYLMHIARPSAARFFAEQTLVNGLVAARDVYHAADHVWGYYQDTHPARVFNARDEKQFFDALYTYSPAFALGGALATVLKHRESTRKKNPLIKSICDTGVEPFPFVRSIISVGPHGVGFGMIAQDRDAPVFHRTDDTRDTITSVVAQMCRAWSALDDEVQMFEGKLRSMPQLQRP